MKTRKHFFDLSNYQNKEFHMLGEDFRGTAPDDTCLDFTNYYMRINGKPFFVISGEYQYSRSHESCWQDELQKMKRGGINAVASYIIWNHHEEKEGTFCFEGNRNLRHFVELCRENGLYVIMRIGPFVHGEARNGGLPDWLYGMPFEVREPNDGFLYYVNRLYQKIGEQLKGLYFKDGGPVIAAQLDNEYGHCGAPWEFTTGTTNEWVNMGHGGSEYMHKLKSLAWEAGIRVPFYTNTGWGGSPCPPDMLPLWGGYAYTPWIFYNRSGSHPATENFLYRDHHSNTNDPKEHPDYPAENYPYACAEMGGGMFCSYYYRFIFPYKSVDAMTNIMMGSGCNFLGYYVFHGGTHPMGNTYMHENQLPKFSYDYQAALGEFGQIRESYKRLKALFYFGQYFGESFCEMGTVLPENASQIDPHDVDTLRYAVRMRDNSGYVFINNFQDHVETKPKENETILLKLPEECIEMGPISLAADENCVLPFNIHLDGILLKYATVQPVARWQAETANFLFMLPEGMEEKLLWEDGVTVRITSHCHGNLYTVSKGEKIIQIFTVSREVMNDLYIVEQNEKTMLLITSAGVLKEKDGICFETSQTKLPVWVYPKDALGDCRPENNVCEDAIWGLHVLKAPEKNSEVTVRKVGPTRYSLDIPSDVLEDADDAILEMEYIGDVGYAFINGVMIHDNFANGDTWELGLRTYMDKLKDYPLTIYITPLKKNATVNVDSPMAARFEEVEEEIGELLSVKIRPVYHIKV